MLAHADHDKAKYMRKRDECFLSLMRLTKTDTPDARQNSSPIRKQDEDEDGSRNRKEAPRCFATPGNSRKKTKQSFHAAFYGGLNIPWRTLYPDEKDERTNDEKEHHKPRGKERVGYWKSSDMKKRFRSD